MPVILEVEEGKLLPGGLYFLRELELKGSGRSKVGRIGRGSGTKSLLGLPLTVSPEAGLPSSKNAELP